MIAPIIKERIGRYCLVRTDSYGKSLGHFNSLIAAARHDFPDLKDSDIQIAVYAGQTLKGKTGIEFTAPGESPIPTDYTIIDKLELRIA